MCPPMSKQDGIGDRARQPSAAAADCASSEVESVLTCASDLHYTCYRNHSLGRVHVVVDSGGLG